MARGQNYSTEALIETKNKAEGSPKDLFVQAQINPQAHWLYRFLDNQKNTRF